MSKIVEAIVVDVLMRRVATVMAAVFLSVGLFAQAPPAASVRFDVISIKRGSPDATSGGIRTLPDGTYVMRNQPISSIILAASQLPVREHVGLPEWAKTERYVITAKPPDGATPEQRAEMMRNLFIDRLKLAGHIEEREQTTFGLIVARKDGRLGPALKPSMLDCAAPPPIPEPSGPPTVATMRDRCGLAMSAGLLMSGGVTMDAFVRSLTGAAGSLVNNRTGLQGPYALTLRFAQRRGPQRSGDPAAIDEPPEFTTALQEQLGLKLQPEKTMVPVFVVDHLERPTEN